MCRPHLKTTYCPFFQMSSAVLLWSWPWIWPRSSTLYSPGLRLQPASLTPKPRICKVVWSSWIQRSSSILQPNHESRPADLSSEAWFRKAVWRTGEQFVRSEPIYHRWIQHKEYKPCQRIFHSDYISVRCHHHSKTWLPAKWIGLYNEDYRK